MKLLLDHFVPNRVANLLREAGHEVVCLRDCLRAASPDRVVIHKATELDAVLISLNGDFADITAYPPESYRGIVAMQVRNRPEAITPITARLVTYLDRHPNRRELVANC